MTSLESYTIDSSLPDVQSMDRNALVESQADAARGANLAVEFYDDMGDGSPAPTMIVIPPGLYEMGSEPEEFGHVPQEGPLHLVSIRHSFAISKYTVTAEEFSRFQHASGFHFRRDLIVSQGRQPVFNIRRAEAEAYTRWLSEQTGQRYRLPSEAEWEYACRAGSRTPFSFGESVTCKEVNFNPAFPYEELKQKRKWYLPQCKPMSLPREVGSYQPNLWGLYDMHGNVWEFTDNYWTDNHQGSPRDGGPGSKIRVRRIVVKGGSYFDSSVKSRSAARMPRVIDELDVNLGLRLVRDI